MRIRTVLTAAVLAAAATLTLAGTASAQVTDRDCRDFASQAAAQSALRSRSGDPERLDSNHNGVACEEYFRTGAVAADPPTAAPPAARIDSAVTPPARPVVDTDPRPAVVDPPDGTPVDAPVKTVPEHQILVKPRGAPDTGDGSATGPADPTPAVLLLAGLGAAVALGAARRPVGRTR